VSEVVTCTVCGREIGKGPGGLGLTMHAKTHRREYREAFGEWPASYELVREKVGRPHPVVDDDQPTLFEALTDDEQTSLSEVME